ncbi:MAG: hypothetical protein AAGH88_15830 [Planctomycetota bacterium]
MSTDYLEAQRQFDKACYTLFCDPLGDELNEDNVGDFLLLARAVGVRDWIEVAEWINDMDLDGDTTSAL